MKTTSVREKSEAIFPFVNFSHVKWGKRMMSEKRNEEKNQSTEGKQTSLVMGNELDRIQNLPQQLHNAERPTKINYKLANRVHG